MERMVQGKRLTKRADAFRVEGRRRRGRLHEERFDGSGKPESEGWRGVEMSGGDASEMGSIMESK